MLDAGGGKTRVPRQIAVPPSTRVINYLRDAVREGRLAPGERVIEREIARDLDIGRGPVREGIQALIQQGLLVRSRQRSPRVKLLTREEILDFLEVWSVLGRLMVRLVSERIRIRDNADRVRASIDRLRESWRPGTTDRHEQLAANAAHIDTMIELAGNPLLRRACDGLNFDLYVGSVSRVYNIDRDGTASGFDAFEESLYSGTPEDVETRYRAFVAFLTKLVQDEYPSEVAD